MSNLTGHQVQQGGMGYTPLISLPVSNTSTSTGDNPFAAQEEETGGFWSDFGKKLVGTVVDTGSQAYILKQQQKAEEERLKAQQQWAQQHEVAATGVGRQIAVAKEIPMQTWVIMGVGAVAILAILLKK